MSIGSEAMQKTPDSLRVRLGRSIFCALLAFTIGPAIAIAQTPAIGSADTTCATTPLPAVPAMHVTHGAVVTRSGRSIAYDAVAGWERVGGDDAINRLLTGDGEASPAVPPGSPAAMMSYIAYFAKGAPSAGRPIMFVWEGGPGTSTEAMVTGSFGPVLRATTLAKGLAVRGNPDTLLDATDLVFVDMPGTGFGHLEGCAPASHFYGIDTDAAAFKRFIQRFLSTHDRRQSPLYLFGESYGTLRAAVVAHRLEDAGVRVSGVVLSSQMLALDDWLDGALGNPGTENAFFLSLPSFSATAWAHDRIPRKGDLETWLRGVEQFSLHDYASALLAGATLPADRKQEVAERLAAYTGLSAQTWFDADLRMEGTPFRTLLEAGQGKLIGREDTRTEGPAPTTQGTAVENDPALTVGRALRKAVFQSYIRGTLQFGDRPFIPDIDVAWDVSHTTDQKNGFPNTYVNAGPDLVDAMKANPNLHVLLFGGYFDLATPYLAGPYLFEHLQLPAALRSNLAWREYPTGHDPYEDAPARRDMHDRIAAMIE